MSYLASVSCEIHPSSPEGLACAHTCPALTPAQCTPKVPPLSHFIHMLPQLITYPSELPHRPHPQPCLPLPSIVSADCQRKPSRRRRAQLGAVLSSAQSTAPHPEAAPASPASVLALGAAVFQVLVRQGDCELAASGVSEGS